MVVGEVLELDDGVGVHLLHRGHELVHEAVEDGVVGARLAEAEVARLRLELLVVRPDVERDGEHLAGVQPGAGDVERALADGDAHPVRPEVAEPEDARAVGDDDDVDVGALRLAEDVPDVALLVLRDVHAVLLGVERRELLARLADGRGVDDGEDLGEVPEDERVVQDVVRVLQRAEELVAVDRLVVGAELREAAHELLLERLDGGRDAPGDAHPVALLDGEGGRLVVEAVAEELDTRELLAVAEHLLRLVWWWWV